MESSKKDSDIVANVTFAHQALIVDALNKVVRKIYVNGGSSTSEVADYHALQDFVHEIKSRYFNLT